MTDLQMWTAADPREPPAATAETQGPPRARPRGNRILLIEDDAIVSLAIEHLLREAGYEIVATCARGEDALVAAKRHRPDLVLADVKLAGAMDGIEAVALIRARHDVPAVFVTAHSDPATLGRMQATRPADILGKPVPDILLVQAVGAALGG
jgi:DNA-binding NarL/FixJ family response regulator